MSAEKYVIVAGWLCETYDGCTCGTPGGSYPHEQYCGVQNIIQVDRLLDEHAALTTEVERLKASIAFKDDAMLTAMRNLVANDTTIERLTAEVERLKSTLLAAEASDRAHVRWIAKIRAELIEHNRTVPLDLDAYPVIRGLVEGTSKVLTP